MTVMTIERIRRIAFMLETHGLPRLYCPECGEYLEGGSGEVQDCLCGWKQPIYEKGEE